MGRQVSRLHSKFAFFPNKKSALFREHFFCGWLREAENLVLGLLLGGDQNGVDHVDDAVAGQNVGLDNLGLVDHD